MERNANTEPADLHENVTRPHGGGGGGGGSRFAYHGDDLALEGGVRSVSSAPSGGADAGKDGSGGAGRAGSGTHAAAPRRGHPAPNGAPGPEERLLDITELVHNVGMRYKHAFKLPAGREEGYETVAPTEGHIALTNSGAALILQGRAETTLRLECARCLAETDQPVEAEIDEQFDLVSGHNAWQQDEVRAVDEDAPASVIKGNVLDLGDLLRQSVLLAAPLVPVCGPDCPGPSHAAYAGYSADEALHNPEPDGENGGGGVVRPPEATHRPFSALAALLEQDGSGR